MDKESCKYSPFCETDGCFFMSDVAFQAKVGGTASPDEHLKPVQQQGPYWNLEAWEQYTKATNVISEKYDCEEQPELLELIQQETQNKLENEQFVPNSPKQSTSEDL